MSVSQHYFITGVSAGIGMALAKTLCAQGHKVTGLARRADRLNEMAQTLPHFNGIVCDVGDKGAVAKAVAQAKVDMGPIDVLIPNAGIYIPDAKGVIDVASFEAHMQVNYMASIYCIAEILPDMLAAKSGHIALMASVAGYRGLPRSTAYGPTKAALINLGEALRFDLHKTGVKVQIICPGFVETEATAVNDFEMPDLISAQQAANEIIKGLQQNQFEIAFPRRFARKMQWLKWLSNDMYFKLVSKATK
mgnify:CR=1 FL=1